MIDLELSLASGNVAYEGAPSPRRCASIRRQASFALGSARLLQKPLRAPSLRVISSWSFPPDTALKANVNKTSGNFTNDFAESAGDSSQPCDLSFDIISGNLEVLGVE